MINKAILALFCLSFSTMILAQSSIPEGPYLGQTPPGKIPQIFAPGFISNRDVVGCTFFPDGQEFYFSRFVSNSNRIMVTKSKDSGWTQPVLAEFNKDFFGGPPYISPDAQQFF